MPEEIISNDGESAASRDVYSGYLSGPGFTEALVRYSVVDGIALYDGCIEMGPAEAVASQAEQVRSARARMVPTGGAGPGAPATGAGGTANGGGAANRNGAQPAGADAVASMGELMGVGLPPTSSFLWTNGVVPFVVDDNLPNAGRVTQAINHIQANTGIRFLARTNHPNWVRFVRNPEAGWSSSAIGMRGGEQLIRLSDGATMGTTVHECLHALGVLHEQSRCDRDEFVTINYQNIEDGFESNFDRFCDGYRDYFEYDYGSIMHYPATAFSKNGQATIVPRQAGVTIGQRDGMSAVDRLTVAEMYSRFTGRGHTGVWRAGTGRYGLWVNADWDSFRAKWQEWAGQGLRLVDLNVRRVGNENRYSGVWLPGTGGYGLWVNASWDAFRAKWQEWSGQGLRLVDLHVLTSGGAQRYSGVFVSGSGGHGLWVNASWDAFRAKWQEWAGRGLRLVDINVQQVNGQDRYSGVWLPGTGGYGLWANASWESFRAKWQEWARQGLRLVDINVHQTSGGTRFSGVFLPGTDRYFLWANVPWQSLRARWEQLGAPGLRLIDYEFTEPAAADAGDLDIAGAPAMVPAADDVPDGAGGLFDGGIPVDVPQPGLAVPEPSTGDISRAPEAAPDGQGGFQPAGDQAMPAGAGEPGAVGGQVPEREAAAAASGTTGDGDGGAVTGEHAMRNGGADRAAEANGAGAAVTAVVRGSG
jgi:hypothetical protein